MSENRSLIETTVALKVTTREVRGVTIIVCAGKIALQDANPVYHLAKSFVDQGRRKLIVDFTEVHYVDSSGIGCMQRILTTVYDKEIRGQFRLFGLTTKVNDLFKAAKAYGVLGFVCSNEGEAIKRVSEA